jgi:hypothetical protein
VPEWVINLIGMLLGAGAVYGGIRAEQLAMMRDISRHERAIERVHKRLDDCGVCAGRRHDDG